MAEVTNAICTLVPALIGGVWRVFVLARVD
jgi:hypothetical protein